MVQYRSKTTTQGRNMAGARSLWRATGMKDADFGKPIIAIANSFTQFVPGHVHLQDVGQRVKRVIEAAGGWGVEFNTIAIDDGIAMGHGGMLYSLPSRDFIADSVEYMVNAHCADALFCISNCDKITPGMLMAAMRLNIPAIFVSGGPMEAGKIAGRATAASRKRKLDLIDAMIASSDDKVTDDELDGPRGVRCPTCGSCSGMFTANSMNCLNEAIGLALPGNGSYLATHASAGSCSNRPRRVYWWPTPALLRTRGSLRASAEHRDASSVRERNGARHCDGRLDQYRAALAGRLPKRPASTSRWPTSTACRAIPNICKVAPSTQLFHLEDVHRAGGIFTILGELDQRGPDSSQRRTVHAHTMGEAIDANDIRRQDCNPGSPRAGAGCARQGADERRLLTERSTTPRPTWMTPRAAFARSSTLTAKTEDWPFSTAISRTMAAS